MNSLRSRLVAAFGLFALITGLCFAAFAVLFVYTVEDSFFNKLLDQEAAHQQQRGIGATPLRDYVSVHRSAATFPPDLRRAMAGGARGSEFAGEQGRHYHVRALAPGLINPISYS